MAAGKIPLSRIALAAAILVTVYFLAVAVVKLADLWMVAFGAVIVAVILRSIADPLVQRLRVNETVAILIAILTLLTAVVGVGFLFGRQIADQLELLLQRLPGAWGELQVRMEASPLAGQVIDQLKGLGAEASHALALAPRFAMGLVSGVTTFVLVMVAGVFLAAQPAQARDGLLSVAPLKVRPRLREVMNASGRALNSWVKAQALSMILVGSLVGLGLWLIGVPAPLALGLVTGAAQFVPIVGPIAAAAPALLVASTEGSHTALLTLGLYLGVSQLEANLITPLVQKNVASLPIVLGIFAVVGLGTLFGPLGVLFANPLTLVLYVALTMLYRQDVLHDPDAIAPGERI